MNNSSKPTITTIVLTWNSVGYIEKCLRSVLASNYPTGILVIDNNSSDNTRALVRKKFPRTTPINTTDNLGYAKGNNFGLRKAMEGSSKYFFILNPDVTVHPDCLGLLVERMESEKQLAAASPIVYLGKDKRIWDAGGEINWENGHTPHTGNGQIDIGQFDSIAYTGRMNGCAMLIRKSVLDTVGLFDENYFLYYEETDWSVACLNAGYKLGFVPKAIAYHAASSATGGQHSPVYEYYLTRNRLYFLHKYRAMASRIYLLRVIYKMFYDLIVVFRKYGLRAFCRSAHFQLLGLTDYFRRRFGRRDSL